jgi:hypothetical protein
MTWRGAPITASGRFWPWGPLGILFLPFLYDQFKAVIIEDDSTLSVMDSETRPYETA